MDSKVIDIVKRIAEEEGWNVTIDGDTLNFQRYSPAGQDFSFDIEIKDEDIHKFITVGDVVNYLSEAIGD